MKKIIITVIAILAITQTYAQSKITGVYDTTFGEMKIVCEDYFLNSQSIIYGDYRDLGTIISTEVKAVNRGKLSFIVTGKFINNEKKGSFELVFSLNTNTISSFTGRWGWGNNLNEGSWNGNKRSNTLPTDLKFAHWSGVWNTTFGEILLKQNGKQVTGYYRDLGEISGTIYGKMLKGTFDNKGKKGSFEFNLDCNKFSGKWGWDSSMKEGKWDGTKKLKTNYCGS